MIDLKAYSLAELADLYNTGADRPIKRFADKPTGKAKIEALAKAKGLVLSADGKKLVKPRNKTTSAGRPKTKGAGGRARFTGDMIIVVVQQGEPKKITKRNPYSVYRTGITVQDALKKGVTRRDLNWDAGDRRPGGPAIKIVPKEQFDRMSK